MGLAKIQNFEKCEAETGVALVTRLMSLVGEAASVSVFDPSQ